MTHTPPTALLADACVRLGLPLRLPPAEIRAIDAGMVVSGRALPVRHAGSVDVFFEAFEAAEPGDILVIDDGGRTHQACIGDLTVLEARSAGVAGLVVWGAHRDTAELQVIAHPVFSLGSTPAGPRHAEARHVEALQSAQLGDQRITRDDYIFGDVDGVLIVPADRAQDVIATAREIHAVERAQAEAIATGRTLREALRFTEYLRARELDPALDFRRHLRTIGGAIEE